MVHVAETYLPDGSIEDACRHFLEQVKLLLPLGRPNRRTTRPQQSLQQDRFFLEIIDRSGDSLYGDSGSTTKS
jgi:hypothetical protein